MRKIRLRAGVGADILERLRVHAGPFFHIEGAGQPAGAVRGGIGSLNQQRARAAAGIVQWLAHAPGGQPDQRGGGRFAQGGLAVPGAVAAAVERIAAQIQRQPGDIAMQGNVHGIARAGLRQGADMVPLQHTIHNGLLGDGLAIAHAHQLAARAAPGHGDGGVGRQHAFPGGGAHQLKQLLKAARLALGHQQQHAVGTGQPQAGGERPGKIRCKAHAAILRARIRKPQAQQLPLDQPLQPEGRRGNECMLACIDHVLLPPCSWYFQGYCNMRALESQWKIREGDEGTEGNGGTLLSSVKKVTKNLCVT